ncbi:MAG: HhH-GPD-type base excision DNA repair protein [Acidimicrobiales bacterium]
MPRKRLYLSGDPEADALLTKTPLALLVGMVLDQQIPLERAFSGPAELARRLAGTPEAGTPEAGTRSPATSGLDAGTIAGMDPGLLAEIFSRTPALHRFPGSMAARVQQLSQAVVDGYGGNAQRIWSEAGDGADLRRRLKALPGFGDQKARIFVALLAKQRGVAPPGWEEASAPYGEPGGYRSVADIVDRSTRDRVRLTKQAAKAAATAAKAGATGPAALR